MKGEITIKNFKDISNIKKDSAAVVLSGGEKKILTFHGTAPGKENYLLVTDSSGNEYYVSKKKLGNLLQGRKG